LDKVYSEQTVNNDLYDLKQNDSIAAELIREQIKYGEYIGFSYREILNDFDNRVAEVIDILESIKRIDSTRRRSLVDIDYFKISNLKIITKRKDIYLSGSIEALKNIKSVKGEVYLLPKFENEIFEKNLCFGLDVKFNFQNYFGNKILESGQRIDFLENTYKATYECPISIGKYKEPKLAVEKVVFEDGTIINWESFGRQLKRQFQILEEKLTLNVFYKIIENNGVYTNDITKEKGLTFKDLSLEEKEDLLKYGSLNGVNLRLQYYAPDFFLRKVYIDY